MLNASSIGISTPPSSSGFVYYQEFSPDNPEKNNTHGTLFCLIASKTHRGGTEATIVGREILSALKQEYYENDLKAFSALKSSVEKVTSKFVLTWGEIEIVAASFVNNVVYSAVWGSSQVSIFRSGMVANVLNGRGELVTASGYPQEGDFLILATKEFMAGLAPITLKETLSLRDLSQIQMKLSSFANLETPLFGAFIVSFGTQETKVESFLPPELKPRQNLLVPLKGFISRTKQMFSKKDSGTSIYIREPGFADYEARGKKTTLTVGVILIALLIISIVFGVRQRNAKLTKSRYETRLTQAVHEFSESESLFSINPERARELFLNSRKVATELQNEGVEDDSLTSLLSKISEKEGEILGEYEANIENFVDLSLVSSGFKGTDIASSGEEIFVLDSSLERIVQVNLSSKRSEVVAGPDDFNGGSQIVSYEDRVFVVNGDGIDEIGSDNKIDKDWDGDVLVYSYAANIYVLQKNTSSIWRYSGSSSGFGSKQSWLGSGLTLDFTDVKSFAIDGSMWILDSLGDVTKFTFGTIDTFNVTGLPGDLSGASSLYTNEELQNLYILDPANARVVVLGKSGEFKVQYLSEDLKNATDLVASEAESRIVILVDGNLKAIAIQN